MSCKEKCPLSLSPLSTVSESVYSDLSKDSLIPYMHICVRGHVDICDVYMRSSIIDSSADGIKACKFMLFPRECEIALTQKWYII